MILPRYSFSLLLVIIVITVSFSNFASGLEWQPNQRSTSHPILTLDNPKRRPFSGGNTRLTSILPTEGSISEELSTERHSHGRILTSVVGLSCINIVYNILRPDPDVGLMVRKRVLFTTFFLCSMVFILIMNENAASVSQLLLSQMRLPRIFWEICIGSIAVVANSAGNGSIFRLFLSMMLCPTALIDIFFWGPILGATTSFHTCTGGYLRGPRICHYDFSKGAGRVVVGFG